MFKRLFVVFVLCVIFHDLNAKCPQGIIEKPMSKADQKRIVDKHNSLRKLIATGKVKGQPRGVNLKKLVWDDKLAKEAQKVADTCVYAHVKIKDSRFKVGQNLHRQRSTALKKGSDWNRAIQSWFDEYKKYKYANMMKKGTGHYTQVVWSETKYVGCAYTLSPISNSKLKYQKLYVCNYGPAGNVKKHYPYKKGTKGCENLC